MSKPNRSNQKTEEAMSVAPPQQPAPAPTQALATIGAPAAAPMVKEDLSEYGDYVGVGHEERRPTDNRVPMIYVLQPLSKVCKDRDRPGGRAEPGDLWNTASDRTYDGRKGVIFVPAAYQPRYVEWFPKAKDGSGGGFVGEYEPNDPLIADDVLKHRFKAIPYIKGVKGDQEKPTELVETVMVYGIILHEHEEWEPVVFPFKGIHLKGWRNYLNMAFPAGKEAGRLPPFSQVAHLTVFADASKQDAMNIRLVPAFGDYKSSRLSRSDERFQAGAALFESVKKGEATADRKAAEKATEGDVGETIPF